MTVIDHKGFRLIAMAVLPVSHDTIVYGSDDGGRTVHTDDDAINDVMQAVGERVSVASGQPPPAICLLTPRTTLTIATLTAQPERALRRPRRPEALYLRRRRRRSAPRPRRVTPRHTHTRTRTYKLVNNKQCHLVATMCWTLPAAVRPRRPR